MLECLIQIIDVLTDIVESVENVEDAIISAWHGTDWFTRRIMGRRNSGENACLLLINVFQSGMSINFWIDFLDSIIACWAPFERGCALKLGSSDFWVCG